MQHELQIAWNGIGPSDAIEKVIRQKAASLEKFYPNITSCRIAVDLPHRHKHQGKRYNIRIDLRVPQGEVVVNRDQHEDIYVALRDAFDAARRRIEDVLRRQRGAVKTHTTPARRGVGRAELGEGDEFKQIADDQE